MNIHFSLEEQIEIIKSAGYTVKKVKVECCQPAYHNDMDYWTETVYGVFKDNKEFCKPTGYGGVGKDWVNNAFNEIVHSIMYKILLNH